MLFAGIPLRSKELGHHRGMEATTTRRQMKTRCSCGRLTAARVTFGPSLGFNGRSGEHTQIDETYRESPTGYILLYGSERAKSRCNYEAESPSRGPGFKDQASIGNGEGRQLPVT